MIVFKLDIKDTKGGLKISLKVTIIVFKCIGIINSLISFIGLKVTMIVFKLQ